MARKNTAVPEVNRTLGDKLLAQAVKQFGESNVETWEAFLDTVYGVPIVRNLPMQYLLGIDAWALGRCISVVGPWGTTKSSFCSYIAAQFLLYNGLVPFIDSERKANPFQFQGIVKALLQSLPERNWFFHTKVASLDQFLDGLIWYVNAMQNEGMTAAGVPAVLIGDSLAHLGSEKGIETLSSEGVSSNQGFMEARNANMIKRTFQAFNAVLAEQPVLALVVNHQKPKVQQEGQIGGRPSYMAPERGEVGGQHKDFAYTWVIQLDKGGVKKSVTEGVVPTYKITMKKNSLGPQRPAPVLVPYRSFWTPGENRTELIWYDWDTALTWLLTDAKYISQTQVKKVIDIGVKGSKYTCRELGLEDVSAQELGAAIHAKDDLVARLQREVFNVRTVRKFGIRDDGVQLRTDIAGAALEEAGEDVPGTENEDEG